MQPRQPEWAWQWSEFDDPVEWLFADWIAPNHLADFAGKLVLDAGCGHGRHAALVARRAARVVAVDLNTAAVARRRAGAAANIEFLAGDVAGFDDGRRFDAIYSVGVVHHTDDPDVTVAHLRALLKPGGRLILWVYSREGNALNRLFLEPLKAAILSALPRPVLDIFSHALTAWLYPLIWSVYLLPMSALPYYEYFANWRRLPYWRNRLNVFDKLNAPVTHFITRERALSWMSGLVDVHLSPYLGASWRISGTAPR
ncbi:MAG: class I SAM-dependent methyltransferase [Elusimicrobia bacterium]|nr:class I SAM-dependent methyltransferase [Elusimicrobiota bacterium]